MKFAGQVSESSYISASVIQGSGLGPASFLMTAANLHPIHGEIISVLQQNRLRWYGHMLQKEDNDWVKKCMGYEVEGARQRGK